MGDNRFFDWVRGQRPVGQAQATTARDSAFPPYSPAPTPPLTELSASDDQADADQEDGVHGVTKNTDYWFERRVNALEQRAAQEAEAWARAGLPLQDVHYPDVLEVEQVLASHARQIYRDWMQRVRTKMQDAIARRSRELGERVGELRTSVARLDAINRELVSREAKIERLRAEADRDKAPIMFHRMVNGALFWPLATLLVLVEFSANFPVFKLLLPLDSTLATAAIAAAENVRDDSWFAGVELFARGLVSHVDASVVALAVVIGLVFMGKVAGHALRSVVSLTPGEFPLAASSIKGFRRQQLTWLSIAGCGLILVLSFLFSARGGITSTADGRVVQDSLRVEVVEVKLRAAQVARDITQMTALSTAVQSQTDVLERHRDEAAYARTIQGNNRAILLLNLGLVFVAIVLGYGYAQENLSDRRGEHPDLPKLRSQCMDLRLEQVATIASARAAVSGASVAEGEARHLAESDPLATWEAKARRLNGIIPHFRAENARIRGVDPSNVKAFSVDVDLALDSGDRNVRFRLPSEVVAAANERDELVRHLDEYRIATSAMDGVAA